LQAVTIAKDSGNSSDGSHSRNTVFKYLSFMTLPCKSAWRRLKERIEFVLYNRSRNRNNLSGAFLLQTKKAPRRNEGLNLKALKKLGQVI
jgi:hypothetical protein